MKLKKIPRLFLIIAILSLALSGCGRKGRLYLPKEEVSLENSES
jgi:predicted small lipoprotein YifL